MPVAGGHLDAGVSEPMIEVATSWVLARDLPARLFTGFSPFFLWLHGHLLPRDGVPAPSQLTKVQSALDGAADVVEQPGQLRGRQASRRPQYGGDRWRCR